MRLRLILAASTAAVAFLVYRLTLMPGVGLIDSGELTLAAWLPGNAHPPGSPVYVLAGWLFTHVLMPFGSVALRMNTMSAVFAAGAAALTAWAALALECAPRPANPPAEKTPKGKRKAAARSGAPPPEASRSAPILPFGGGLLPALAAGLSMAFSRSLWAYGVITEVYAVNIALVAGAVACTIWWRADEDRTRADRRLFLGAFLFGLALGVHHGTAGACAPGIAVFLLHRDRTAWKDAFSGRKAAEKSAARRRLGRRYGLGALFILAGLLAYAYMPLRALADPLLNWGDPRTLQRFWWQIGAKYFQTFMFEETFGQSLSEFLSSWTDQMGLLGLLGTVAGLVLALRRDRAFAVFALCVAAGNFVILFAYGASDDRPAFILPTVLVSALLVGEAVHALAAAAARPGARLALWRAAAILGAAAVPVSALAGNWKVNDQSRNHIAEDFAHNALSAVGPKGVLFSAEWMATVSPLMYLQHVAGERPDVTVLDVNLVQRSWYAGYVRQADPLLYAAVEPLYREFLGNVFFFENDRCKERPAPECALIQGSFERLNAGMATWAHGQGRPVYMTPDVDVAVAHAPGVPFLPSFRRVPVGVVFELTTRPRPAAPESEPKVRMRGLLDGTVQLLPGSAAREKVPGLYAGMLAARAEYLLGFGDRAGAEAALRTAQALAPAHPAVVRLLELSRGPRTGGVP